GMFGTWSAGAGSSGAADTPVNDLVLAYILFSLAIPPLVMWIYQMVFFGIAWYTCRYHLHRPKSLADMSGSLPGVSIVKPLMGIDTFLEGNLESHFTLQYPKYELLLCVQDEQDPVIGLVNNLRERFPNVDCRLFIGGKDGIVNPMVHNMVPAYENAKHDLVWVSTSRIRASTPILMDLVARAVQDPTVAIVHQLPFMRNDSVHGMAAIVEKVAFGCNLGKQYLSLSQLGTHIFTGMSYLVRKPYLDKVGGLAYYGRYLAEDFCLSRDLLISGYQLVLSAFPAEQMVATASLPSYKDRMVRWWRLRLSMMPVVTLVLEPLTESLLLGAYTSWAVYYLFDVNPYYAMLVHLAVWIVLDYAQLKRIQNGPLPFSFPAFLAAWWLRELLNWIVYAQGLANPRRVFWGRSTYKLQHGGLTTAVTSKPSVPM
ncbi:hypothetical protein BOX15_Mlig033235g20, partial [Macrostomum lignano]